MKERPAEEVLAAPPAVDVAAPLAVKVKSAPAAELEQAASYEIELAVGVPEVQHLEVPHDTIQEQIQEQFVEVPEVLVEVPHEMIQEQIVEVPAVQHVVVVQHMASELAVCQPRWAGAGGPFLDPRDGPCLDPRDGEVPGVQHFVEVPHDTFQEQFVVVPEVQHIEVPQETIQEQVVEVPEVQHVDVQHVVEVPRMTIQEQVFVVVPQATVQEPAVEVPDVPWKSLDLIGEFAAGLWATWLGPLPGWLAKLAGRAEAALCTEWVADAAVGGSDSALPSAAPGRGRYGQGRSKAPRRRRRLAAVAAEPPGPPPGVRTCRGPCLLLALLLWCKFAAGPSDVRELQGELEVPQVVDYVAG